MGGQPFVQASPRWLGGVWGRSGITVTKCCNDAAPAGNRTLLTILLARLPPRMSDCHLPEIGDAMAQDPAQEALLETHPSGNKKPTKLSHLQDLGTAQESLMVEKL